MKTHPSAFFSRLAELSSSKHDADRLLDSLKDARRDFRLVPFRRAINHPDFGTGAPEIVAHLLEARTIKETSHRYEANNPFFVLVRKTRCRIVT